MIDAIRGAFGLKSSDKGKDDKDRDDGHSLKAGVNKTGSDDETKQKSAFKKLFKIGNKEQTPHEEHEKPKEIRKFRSKDGKPGTAPVKDDRKKKSRKKPSNEKAGTNTSRSTLKTEKLTPSATAPALPPTPPVNPRVKEEVSKYSDKITDQSVPGLTEDFKKLDSWHPENTDAVACNQPENLNKCRLKDISCFEASRVKLKNDAFIHANYLTTDMNKYIITQAPLDNTIETFWQMAVEERCEAVIMLCNITENGQKKCAEYYPQTLGGSATFGEYTIKTSKGPPVMEGSNISTLTVQVSGPSGQITIKHFHVTDWPEKGVPESVELGIMNVLSLVRGNKTVIVHSSLGVGRAGMLMLTEFMHNRLMSARPLENSIEALKELRRQRAFAVPNNVQFLYSHRLLLHYLSEKKILDLSQRYLEFVDDYDAAIRKWKREETEKGGN